MMVVSGVYMIKCTICGRFFKARGALFSHKRWVHGVLPEKQAPLSSPGYSGNGDQLLELTTLIMTRLDQLGKHQEEQDRLLTELSRTLKLIDERVMK